ncbi:hypothetical protein AB205_0221110 [Aquarana catesbeiana]|uniref:C2H2-type domain-containing protein n=1 Tax=Aquarana catesbeiana TaxID=8400 RepID=A0A2G9RHK2_AQUCT|nr:hypothetical protein AB205_0221110 [Aquarana catesbeiana]
MYSVNGSSNGNPPERCPYPLYSWDSTQEGHTIPHHHQSGNLRDSKADIKEEIKEENDEDGVMEKSESLKVHKDLYQDTMVESSSYRNPPERCPRPLYSRNSTQEGHIIPHHHQGEDLIGIKVESKAEEEESYVRDDQQSMEEDGITGTFIEEDTPTEISTDCKVEDEDITQYSPGENPATSNVHPAPHSSGNLRDSKVEVKEEITEEEDEEDGMTEESESPKEHKDLHQDTMVESSSYRSPPGRCSLYSGDSTQESPTKPHHHQSGSLRDYNIVVKEEYTDEDDEYGMFGELSEGRKGHYKNIMMKSPPTEISTGSAIKKPSKEHPTLWKMEDEDITQDCAVEKKISSTMDGGAHSVDRPSNPSDSDLARTVGDADKIQEQKKFSCSECGELFSSDLILSIYRSFHEGDKLHFCSECGKGFVCKSELVEHSKSHTGEKPFAKHVAERSSDLYNGRSTLNGNR